MTHHLTQAIASKFSQKLGFLYNDLVTRRYRIVDGECGQAELINFYEFLPEIPKNQRFVNRPELGRIFTEGVLRDMGRRDQKVEEAVERHGYTQRQVVDFFGLHFASVSRIMNQRSKMQRK